MAGPISETLQAIKNKIESVPFIGVDNINFIYGEQFDQFQDIDSDNDGNSDNFPRIEINPIKKGGLNYYAQRQKNSIGLFSVAGFLCTESPDGVATDEEKFKLLDWGEHVEHSVYELNGDKSNGSLNIEGFTMVNPESDLLFDILFLGGIASFAFLVDVRYGMWDSGCNNK